MAYGRDQQSSQKNSPELRALGTELDKVFVSGLTIVRRQSRGKIGLEVVTFLIELTRAVSVSASAAIVTSNSKIEMDEAAEIAKQSDRRRFDIGGETECQRGRGWTARCGQVPKGLNAEWKARQRHYL